MSVAEMLVAIGVAVGVGSAALTLVNVSRTVATTQPEVADLQQRLRVGIDAIAAEVASAGAGFDRTELAGPLARVVPPVVPYRRGQVRDDGSAGVWFRPDVMSVLSVASAQAQASVTGAVNLGGRLRVTLAPNCGDAAPVAVCGFSPGMRVLLAHPSGAHDFLTVDVVAGALLELTFVGTLAAAYDDGRAAVAHVAAATFAPGVDAASGTPQIDRYDGFLTTHPAVDHIVGLSFDYFALADPPVMRDANWLPRWRAVSYGPPPPRIGEDDPVTAWGPGENCTFAVRAAAHVPRLSALGPSGTLVPLAPAALSDGPWCPDSTSPRRYDADALRVRRVRVRVRAEAPWASLRGWGPMVRRPGTPSALTTTLDHEAVIDVAPRNLLPWH